MNFTRPWGNPYEASPGARTSPALGDDQIRNLKVDVRERMDREHQFDPATEELAKQGLHKAGSAMPFIQATEPLTRMDNTAFHEDYDVGRMWINTSKGGKMYYLAEVLDTPSAGTPVWKPALSETIGKVIHFASTPPVEDRWLLCDGRLITDSEESEDGVEGGYAELVTLLHDEANEDVDHPYYASAAGTSAYIPDLRGSVIRGLENGNNTSDNRDPAKGTDLYDADGIRKSGGFQESAIMDHDHQMDHTHGKQITSGYDTTTGRTGEPTSWLNGEPEFDENENATWKSTTHLTADGKLSIIHTGEDRNGSWPNSVNVAKSTRTNVYLRHWHKVARFFGLTRKVSVQDEDVNHGVPERDYPTLDSDNAMSNVALYAYIKY
jgi:hypothetical protein